ncbi:MAG: hypothetical protein AB7O60_17425, partial [Variibacter sp.]
RLAVFAGIGASIKPLSSWLEVLHAGVAGASRIYVFSLGFIFWLSRSAPPSTAAADAVHDLLEKIVEEKKPPAA